MSESTTTTEDYKKLKKIISSYNKAKRINEQQKELRKNPQSVNSQTNIEIEKVEAKSKKKIETFTRKVKEFPKKFKDEKSNQLEELLDTYKKSRTVPEEPGTKGLPDNEKLVVLQQRESELNSELTKAIADGKVEEQERITKEIENVKKNIRKTEISIFRTDHKDSLGVLRDIMIQTVNKSAEQIKKILETEYANSLGCSQEQTYQSKEIYVKILSIDIFGKTLQTNPNGVPGKYIYEFKPFKTTSIPRSFNRELWNRIQKEGQSYQQEYSFSYLGASGQELFDIEYIKDPKPNLIGDYFKVTLKSRQGGNVVAEFLSDYLNTIDILNFNELFANVLNILLGSINMKSIIGYDDLRNQSKFEKIIQRLLSLCFDNKQEIDVTGTGKLSSSDQIDDSIFVLSDEDLLEIESKVKNIQEKVVQYKDCGSLSLPVNVDGSLDLLEKFQEEIDSQQADSAAQEMIKAIGSNPDWLINFPQFNFSNIINEQFIKLLPIAVLNSVLSPKHLFPLFVMGKALQKDYFDSIETSEDFLNENRKLVINVSTKIQAIFIKELFTQIKKNLKSLMAAIVRETANEILTNKQKLILQGINIALSTFAAVQDVRRCKNVVNELLRIVSLSYALRNALKGTPSDDVPTIINYVSAAAKGGMSPTSVMTKFIEKMEEQGVPTGDMPSGKPNVGMLMQKSKFESFIDELTQNGFAQTTITGKEVAEISATGFVKVKGNVI